MVGIHVAKFEALSLGVRITYTWPKAVRSVMEGYLGAEVFLKLKVSESESTREPVSVAKAVLEL